MKELPLAGAEAEFHTQPSSQHPQAEEESQEDLQPAQQLPGDGWKCAVSQQEDELPWACCSLVDPACSRVLPARQLLGPEPQRDLLLGTLH